MDRDKAIALMRELLEHVNKTDASDLFITVGFAPAIKVHGEISPVSDHALSQEEASLLVYAIMNDRQRKEFDATHECNFAIAVRSLRKQRGELRGSASFRGFSE